MKRLKFKRDLYKWFLYNPALPTLHIALSFPKD